MTENWKVWEGRTVDGKFVLGDYLGGPDGSAVFRTRARIDLLSNDAGNRVVGSGEEAADAAIKLIAAGGAEAESQLRRWKTPSELRHPNLIRILAVGRCAVEGRELVYAVEEFAEENLAEIVPERALTAEEVREMLGPVLAALEFVHGRGLVHGRIKPSNILAARDQVKVSSDSLGVAGAVPRTMSAHDAPEVAANGISTAGDVWSLGITVVEVFTQRLPVWDAARMSPPEVTAGIPEPFRGIAQRCLAVDPAQRCGIREIRDRLEGKGAMADAATTIARPANAARDQKLASPVAIAAVARKKPQWPVWLAAGVIVVGVLLTMRHRSEPGQGQTSSVTPQTAQNSAQQPTPSSETRPAPAQTGAAMAPAEEETKPAAKDEIVQRAMPQVSASAQRTIQGKVKVRVRVKVDAAGDVTTATLKDAGPSKYFAREALKAGKEWKFAPAWGEEESREWTLLFVFTRARTEVSATRAKR